MSLVVRTNKFFEFNGSYVALLRRWVKVEVKKTKESSKNIRTKYMNDQSDAFSNAMSDLNQELYRCRYDS